MLKLTGNYLFKGFRNSRKLSNSSIVLNVRSTTFLCRGIINDCFQIDGKDADCKDNLNNFRIGSVRFTAQNLSTQPGIPSGPGEKSVSEQGDSGEQWYCQ